MYFVNFTEAKLERFKVDYNKATSENKKEFIFEGDVFMIGYAKYVIEYLEERFSKKVSL